MLPGKKFKYGKNTKNISLGSMGQNTKKIRIQDQDRIQDGSKSEKPEPTSEKSSLCACIGGPNLVRGDPGRQTRQTTGTIFVVGNDRFNFKHIIHINPNLFNGLLNLNVNYLIYYKDQGKNDCLFHNFLEIKFYLMLTFKEIIR